MTHISYEMAKELKAFLGDKAPEPMKGEMGTVWIYDPECPDDGILQGVSLGAGDYPAYQLHDLLSKPFCEAVVREYKYRSINHWKYKKKIGLFPSGYSPFTGYEESLMAHLARGNFEGGLPAVEKALKEMMEGK